MVLPFSRTETSKQGSSLPSLLLPAIAVTEYSYPDHMYTVCTVIPPQHCTILNRVQPPLYHHKVLRHDSLHADTVVGLLEYVCMLVCVCVCVCMHVHVGVHL